MKIVLIGAGNLATQLSQEMRRVGMTITQVYSRTAEHARLLAKSLRTEWTDSLADVRTDAELYVFAVRDSVLVEVIASLPVNKGLWIHTAGSMPMSVFAGYTTRYGVLYPLQTFSRERNIRLNEVPFFLETATDEDAKILLRTASAISSRVIFLPSDKRKYLHLAAVFACNFTNHMYAQAEQLLEAQGIPSDVLLPLIDETAAKIHSLPPAQAQTGPAVRNDRSVIDAHLAMLDDPALRALYEQISNSIYTFTNHE